MSPVMVPSFFFLFLMLSVACGRHHNHNCAHDEIPAPPYNFAAQEYYEPTGHGRRTTSNSYEPIRIHVITQNLAALDSARQSFLMNTLVPAAVSVLSRALSVVRVQGPLRVNRNCGSTWQVAGSPCASVGQPVRCGYMPDGTSAAVADYLLNSLQTCSTCNADGTCNPSSCTTSANGTGVSNADFVLYVTSATTGSCPASAGDGTLAYASTCVRDQYDRPIMGQANFCPVALSSSSSAWEDQLSTAVHEPVPLKTN